MSIYGVDYNIQTTNVIFSASETGNQVVVYAPYLILNKTGLDVQVKTRTNTATSKVSSLSSLSGAEGMCSLNLLLFIIASNH